MTPTTRIAMWSGPRNISTALMRSFGNRPDCIVVDEPFYAAYLAETGLHHPMRDEVLAAQPTDPREVIRALLGPIEPGKDISYQKQMTHHMRPAFDRAWMAACRNVFLIRAPEHVLASYRARRESVSLGDLGYVQQAELFDAEADRLGTPPPVMDAADILADPRAILGALCRALAIPFLPEMLSWPTGRRATDGVWAPAWYGAVEQSTGFSAPALPTARAGLDPRLQSIADAARPLYDRLRAFRLTPIR